MWQWVMVVYGGSDKLSVHIRQHGSAVYVGMVVVVCIDSTTVYLLSDTVIQWKKTALP